MAARKAPNPQAALIQQGKQLVAAGEKVLKLAEGVKRVTAKAKPAPKKRTTTKRKPAAKRKTSTAKKK